MKTIKYLSMLALLFTTATSCMNNFDTPQFSEPQFGNNEIGEANTTIAKLKEDYATVILNNDTARFTDDIIIEGVVVANDEEGNVYKQFVINDSTGAIIIGVNDVGLYATMPVGQRVRIACKDLYIGGYGKMAQIGTKYFNPKYSEWQIGRMTKLDFQKHVRIIGEVNPNAPELTPTILTEEFLNDNNNKKSMPIYVELRNVKLYKYDEEQKINLFANDSIKYAPEDDQISETNTAVERKVAIGSKEVIFRLSTYADFANSPMPSGDLNIKGVLTRYNDYWQFLLSSTNDIEQAN